jgi:hypothetical protein
MTVAERIKARTTVAALTGETDHGTLDAIIDAALAEPVNLHGEVDTATMLAKVCTALPMPLPTGDLGAADLWAARRLEPLEKAAEHGGAVSAEHLRVMRSDVAGIAFVKTIPPQRLGHPVPRPAPDNRAELRELRDRARAQGNREGAAMWEHEIDMAEARQILARPTGTIGGGVSATSAA